MLSGRFGNTTGRPYVEGRLIIPRLGLRGDISFLVDTGADRTVIMPLDAIRVRVDRRSLSDSVQSVGIGGTSNDYEERSLIAFAEPGKRVFVYDAKLIFATPTSDNHDIPSLLGRDILDRWRIVYDKGRGKLTFTVQSADLTMPV